MTLGETQDLSIIGLRLRLVVGKPTMVETYSMHKMELVAKSNGRKKHNSKASFIIFLTTGGLRVEWGACFCLIYQLQEVLQL